ncbi:alpha/beta fold hydrolase [Modestobacter sp. VKM Ac-2986]|uniref:alpha/beta hydrolase n=1 Tax=Modestobacter sp. VKM Ac-2986 TaxID=3004140 RepID=UPI0022AAB7B0|nr:alpha/beta fold hydrolase [Modestobacter sp. VKM Ac-2986]MCZ2828347.1 alpha/beta fold hydrolase [Modestobacter sp. VKM Ac-2986]
MGTGGRRDRTARLRRRLDADPRVHRVRRPVAPDRPGQTFELAYVREGPAGDQPLLVLPGGPGLASVLPYAAFRDEAARRGIDVVMVEHRGVGLSRTDDEGRDLPPEAFTIEQVVADLAAVLDDCGASRAVVHGSSYGSYLAAGFGVRHPGRVAGMVLDSAVLSAHDDRVVRRTLRELYWEGRHPSTARAAELMRAAVASGAVTVESTGAVAQLVHEFAGPDALEQLLRLRLSGRGRRTWERLSTLGAAEADVRRPLFMESDLVARIAFAELGYAPDPDGQPLDVNLSFAAAAAATPFTGEPYDLRVELPDFSWPTAVVSGDRDLRAPRAVAEEVTGLLPDAVLVPLAGTGHSALDTHRAAALLVDQVVRTGGHHRLSALAPRLSALPRRGPSRLLGTAVRTALAVERVLPASRAG